MWNLNFTNCFYFLILSQFTAPSIDLIKDFIKYCSALILVAKVELVRRCTVKHTNKIRCFVMNCFQIIISVCY